MPWRWRKDIFYLGLLKVWVLFARVATVRLLKGPSSRLSPFPDRQWLLRVLFLAPQGLPVVPKSVVFVIDVSGSMHGRKMEQVLFLVQGWVTDERHREIFLKWMKLIFQ